MKQQKEIYEANLKDLQESRKINTFMGELTIDYTHEPNVVGERNTYTGLLIWVGKTTAKTTVNGKVYETVAKCWVNEPFTYSRARIVATGRLLKKVMLPTSIADQVKD
jgi:hypothetical protein